MQKRNLEWAEFHHQAFNLASLIKQNGVDYSAIVAVARGGLFLAGSLSHILDIRDIRTVCVKAYSECFEQGAVEYLTEPPLEPFGPYLLVDDLVDSGNTLTELTSTCFTRATTATLYKKNNSCFTPDKFVTNVDSNQWIVFPWEI